MVKCFAVENSLTIDTDGSIKPCCKFIGKFGNVYQDKINTEKFKNLNNKIWPVGCAKCKIAEDNNVSSRRQRYETRFRDNDFLLDLSMGNYCNLKCRMCNEKLSTKWYSDARKLGRTVPKSTVLSKQDIDKIFDNIPKDKNITIELKGGEPLVSPNIEYVFDKADALNCKIICITNGTVMPDWFIDRLQYMNIELNVSIDGTQDTYEYVRGDKIFTWQDCLNRIQYLENLDIESSRIWYNYVVQNLTIDSMLEFENLVSKKINWIILTDPSYLSCNILPDENKNNIVNKLLQLTTCPNGLVDLFLKKCDDELYKKFIIESQKLDKLRNQNLKIVAPYLLNKFGENLYDSV